MDTRMAALNSGIARMQEQDRAIAAGKFRRPDVEKSLKPIKNATHVDRQDSDVKKEPSLDDTYNSLTSEQKAKVDAIGKAKFDKGMKAYEGKEITSAQERDLCNQTRREALEEVLGK